MDFYSSILCFCPVIILQGIFLFILNKKVENFINKYKYLYFY